MEITRFRDVNVLMVAAYQAGKSGADQPTLGMRPGGFPCLTWANGSAIYLDAFGHPVQEGQIPFTPPPELAAMAA